jgi:cell division septum initiation protein DivIVA
MNENHSRRVGQQIRQQRRALRSRQRGGGYPPAEVDGVLDAALAAIDQLENKDEKWAQTSALEAQRTRDLLLRLKEAEGSLDENSLRMQRAERMTELQVQADRMMAATEQRARAVIHDARRRATEILEDAERRAQTRSETALPDLPSATGDRVADALAMAQWYSDLEAVAGQGRDELRAQIEEAIEGLRRAVESLRETARPMRVVAEKGQDVHVS